MGTSKYYREVIISEEGNPKNEGYYICWPSNWWLFEKGSWWQYQIYGGEKTKIKMPTPEWYLETISLPSVNDVAKSVHEVLEPLFMDYENGVNASNKVAELILSRFALGEGVKYLNEM